MEGQSKIHSSIKDLISEIKDDFSPLINILVKKNEDYKKKTQLNIKKINQILTNMENNPQSIITNNIGNIKTILKSCDEILSTYLIDSKIKLNNISIKLIEISSKYLAFIKSSSNNKNLAVEMENSQKELNDNKNKYKSLNQNYMRSQKNLSEMKAKNKNDSKLEKEVKKRNKTLKNNRNFFESDLSTNISKLLSEKNARYTELQKENLEIIKENNKMKQNIIRIKKDLNILKINQLKSRNNNELENHKYSAQEQTITSDNKIGLNVENEIQYKEKIKALENEIKELQNKNNRNDCLKDMGKKQMELLEQLDKYKCKNEQLKNQLKKNQNEFLLNQIKEIEEKYSKELEKNKMIFEEDIHKKIILINDLKLENMDLKKELANKGKNDKNINGIQELRNSIKEIPYLKSQNQELENQNIKERRLNEKTLENVDNCEIELNSTERTEKEKKKNYDKNLL